MSPSFLQYEQAFQVESLRTAPGPHEAPACDHASRKYQRKTTKWNIFKCLKMTENGWSLTILSGGMLLVQ